MTLKQWSDNRWLRSHRTSRQEIRALFQMVERDLSTAKKDIPPDWQFGIAYNAALKLCTILLYAEGYRPEKDLAHYRTLAALPLILGKDLEEDAEYLQRCRKKRNEVEYDSIGGATANDVKELIAFTAVLREKVLKWLAERHPELTTDAR